MVTAQQIADERGLTFNKYGIAIDEHGNEYRHTDGQVVVAGEEYEE